MSKSKLILGEKWGGLGDNLQFSTLPELCHNNDIDFYLHASNKYRFEGIYDLVWKSNPYVKGIINEAANGGSVINYQNYTDNMISNWEFLHGFRPENKLPKIYYTPKIESAYENSVFIDTGRFSNSYTPLDSLLTFLSDEDISVYQLIPQNDNAYREIIDSISILYYSNIFSYADLIASCQKFICFFSGSSVLASSIRGNKTTYCVTNNHDKSFYKFDNIIYAS